MHNPLNIVESNMDKTVQSCRTIGIEDKDITNDDKSETRININDNITTSNAAIPSTIYETDIIDMTEIRQKGKKCDNY